MQSVTEIAVILVTEAVQYVKFIDNIQEKSAAMCVSAVQAASLSTERASGQKES